MSTHKLSDRQRSILEFIVQEASDRGFPPSVREIGEAVGLSSPATVHSHLSKLEAHGFIERDPSKPRAIKVSWDAVSGASQIERRPASHIPLVGDVAAGTDVLAAEHIEETFPIPVDFTGEGELFMLTVRGESMIDVGIYDGDYVIARVQTTAGNGDIVVAGIPGEEATVKTYTKKRSEITLTPANETMEPMVFSANDVQIFGRVVTVIRSL